MNNLEQQGIDKIEALQEVLRLSNEHQLQTESNWIARRAQCPEYRKYTKAKRDLEVLREEFGALWWGLSLGVREELAAQFWPDVPMNENFDHSGLPIRIYRKDIRDFNDRYPTVDPLIRSAARHNETSDF